MKRILFILVTISIVLFAGCATSGEESMEVQSDQPAVKVEPAAKTDSEPSGGSGTIVVLHTNDHHGHPLSFYNYPAPGQGGLPARATLVNEIRAENDNVLLLDAGDVNMGRPESMFFKAEPDFLGYNYIGYDAMAIGNHEFDEPHSVLKEQMEWADFPFLSANVKYKSGGYVGEPYIVKEYNGLRVGIFGLTTTEVNEIAGDVESVKDLVIEDEVKASKEMVSILRDKEKVDLIIALAHVGTYNNNITGTRYIAANVPEIDLIIGGHTHMPDILAGGHWDMKAPFVENGVPIVVTQEWGLQLGKAEIEVRDGEVTGLSWEMVPVNMMRPSDEGPVYVTSKIEEDQELLAMLKPFEDKVEAVLSEQIGTAAARFPSEDVRVAETAIGNLIADAMLWKTESMGAQFALVNSGGIRGGLEKGNITKKDIYAAVPYDNSVFVLTMKGSEVLELFDSIGKIDQGRGGFPQVSSGVSFTKDAAAGEVKNITIQGKPVDPEATYKIATNSFLAGGGDGYSVFKKAIQRYDTAVFQRDVVIEYIQTFDQPIVPRIHDRFEVINGVSMIDDFDTAA